MRQAPAVRLRGRDDNRHLVELPVLDSGGHGPFQEEPASEEQLRRHVLHGRQLHPPLLAEPLHVIVQHGLQTQGLDDANFADMSPNLPPQVL